MSSRLPDDTIQDPRASIALTGLYPELRTNTPVHMSEYCATFHLQVFANFEYPVTFPHAPFPDHTDLFPHWTVVLDYLQNYASKWGLYSSEPEDWDRTANLEASTSSVPAENLPPLKFSNTDADEARRQLPRRILCNREVYSAAWTGSTEHGKGGKWKVTSKPFPRTADDTQEYEDTFDAIIDGTGHLVHPSIPHWKGEDEWLFAKAGRQIIHSAFYRGPAAFKDKTVLVIGAG